MIPRGSLILFAIGSLLALLTAGCGKKSAQESFLRPDTDLGFVRSVAVLPFENNSQDRYVSERLRDITTTGLLVRNMFEIIEKGVVDGALAEESVTRETPVDGKIMKRLGQKLGVQAFFIGVIDDYGEGRRGSYTYPEIALTYRLVEANSAKILWQASGRRKGETFGGRLFGSSPEDDFQISLNLTRELLDSMTAESKPVEEKKTSAKPAEEKSTKDAKDSKDTKDTKDSKDDEK